MQPAAATGKRIALRKLRPQWVFGFLNVWKSVCMEVTVDGRERPVFSEPIGDNVRTVGLSDSSCQAA